MSSINGDAQNLGERFDVTRRPLISIITINFNNAAGLARTLSSVSEQKFTDFEHIVIDGASTDGSLDCIRRSENGLAHWVSEPDTGVYDAQNKGIGMACGRFLLFLNSGDHFCSADSLAAAILALGDEDIQYFDLVVRGAPGAAGSSDWVKSYPDHIDFSYMAVDSLPHPATFIKASLFSQYGPYDQSLRICADWKHFTLWICKYNCSYKHHAQPLSVFYRDGLSENPRNREAVLAERRHVIRTEFPAFEKDLRDLVQARGATRALAAVRKSKVIRLLQKVGVLWDF